MLSCMQCLRNKKRHQLVRGIVDKPALRVGLVYRDLAQRLVGDDEQDPDGEILAPLGKTPQIQPSISTATIDTRSL
jgi:hypothetical protein